MCHMVTEQVAQGLMPHFEQLPDSTQQDSPGIRPGVNQHGGNEMKPEHVIAVAKSGEIYIPKLTTKYLGIFGWTGVVIAVEKTYIYMRFFKQSLVTKKDSEIIVKLQKKSDGRQAMIGGCRKFAEAINSDFGDANRLDLHIKTILVDEESVRISLDRPSRIDEEPTPEIEEKAETSKEVATKAAQVELARYIRANGCAEVSCGGTEAQGKFVGVTCPLRGRRGGCGRRNLQEGLSAENWLISNGYSLEPETSLGTVSKPAEKQLDIFDLPRSKAASSPRTRPLPDGLPEWLRGPLSKGEQVWVTIRVPGEKASQGWAIGTNSRFGKFSVAVADDTEFHTKVHLYHPKYIFQPQGTLKPSAECFKVAVKLGIGLSALQIEAINSGGVPLESHGLPGEMFE
jgi:hypothetical protein